MLFCSTTSHGIVSRSPFLRLLCACIRKNGRYQMNRSIFNSAALKAHLLESESPLFFGQSLFCKLRTGTLTDNRVICYTDGSCINNGRPDTVASIGVYWGEQHEDNVSESLGVGCHTNNRAELQAVVRALEIFIERRYRHVVIRTDSELIVKTFNEWLKLWKLNGWRRANKSPIKNLDLIQQIDHLISSNSITVLFEHWNRNLNKNAHLLAQRGMKG